LAGDSTEDSWQPNQLLKDQMKETDFTNPFLVFLYLFSENENG
jgi:hypothetical protein